MVLLVEVEHLRKKDMQESINLSDKVIISYYVEKIYLAIWWLSHSRVQGVL